MKINQIRLHPFAGVSDQTFKFDKGLNLLSAENENGKSTLFSAISAVLLFEINSQRRSEDNKLISRFKPQPGGNKICITLNFTANEVDYTLNKSWDVATPQLNNVTLDSKQSNWTGDEAQVHLKTLLQLNRASWEYMLFIEQSSIHQTIGRLKNQMRPIDDIRSRIEGADSFDRSRFLEDVKNELKNFENRWDNILERPQDGRGIDNPWINNVGTILAAWYEKEKCQKDYQKILADETRIGELNQEIGLVSAVKIELDDLIRGAEPLVMNANSFIRIEGEKMSVENEYKILSNIQPEWIQAEALLPLFREQLNQLTSERQKLEEERTHAEKRERARHILNRDADVQGFARDLKEQRVILHGMPVISEARLQEAFAAEIAIKDARLVLEAQQLKATLESSEDIRVTACISGEEPKEIVLRPGVSETFSSRGSISINYGSVHMRVVSGNVDVDELESSISKEEQKILEICKESNLNGIQDLRDFQAKISKVRGDINDLENKLNSLLGGRTLEQWNMEVAEINQIPNARDIGIIHTLLVDLGTTIADKVREINKMEESVIQWGEKYQNLTVLMDKVVGLKAKIIELETEANALRALLPEGFADSNQYIREIGEKRNTRNELVERLTRLEVERESLMVRIRMENSSAEELLERKQVAEMSYDNRLKHAKALRRILEVDENLSNVVNTNPFEAVGKRISDLVKALSGGRYSTVSFDTELPSQIGDENFQWNIDLLSKGMMSSLALAVRLAYAEVYLNGMDGFLMLDDPFTELDSSRRKLAVEVLKKMAQTKQMIIFTCHEEHAKLFEGNGVNRLEKVEAFRPGLDKPQTDKFYYQTS